MNAADVLERAADVIVERGWYRGNYYSDPDSIDTCSVCAQGAIHVATVGTPSPARANDELLRETAVERLHAQRALGRYVGCSIPEWNDMKAESADEVITALRECAASLRGGAK